MVGQQWVDQRPDRLSPGHGGTGSTRSTGQPGAGFELVSWYFFRLSGALLLVLALGHVVITHYLNAPADTTFDFVAARWAGPLWRTFDWLLLVMALLHGLNGLHVVIDDYVHPPGWRVIAQSVNATLAIGFVGLGSLTIFTFDPARTTGTTDLTACHVVDGGLVAIAVLTYAAIVGGALWAGRALLRGDLLVYRGDVGQWAWLLHRATGLGVLLFLLLHVVDIALLGLGPAVYDCTIRSYARPLLYPMEIALVGAVMYHALNGLRIIWIDFAGRGVRYEREAFYAVLALAVLLVLPSVYVLVSQH